MRMLLVGYIMGIRSERRLCDEVHLNLAYRWFCKLDLTDPIPDHSTFPKTDMVVSVTVICCAMCSKPLSLNASMQGWRAVSVMQRMRVLLLLMLTGSNLHRRLIGTLRRLTRMKRHAPLGNIWKHLMTPRLARPVPLSLSLSRTQIRRPNGPAHAVGLRILLIPRTI